MAEYIEREALIQRLENSPLFTNFGEDGYFIGNGVIEIIKRQPIMNSSADVVEVRHGKWHIMPEDPEDESECPTEEGWYRIITTEGEELTDYYFNKLTLVGRGVVYWKNCKSGIRAWAKMDGKENGNG